MSVKQISQVFSDTSITSNQKLVMLAMADFASDEGVCFPSIQTLQVKCSLSKQAVISNLKKLEEASLIVKKYRSRRSGGRSSNKYLLYPVANKHLLDEETLYEFGLNNVQSQENGLPPQSQESRPPPPTQSQESRLECEPSLSEPSLPPYKSPQENTEKKESKNKNAKLTLNDFCEQYPNKLAEWWLFASDRGINRETFENELLKFTNHYGAINERSLTPGGWTAIWQNWCLSPYRSTQPKNGNASSSYVGAAISSLERSSQGPHIDCPF